MSYDIENEEEKHYCYECQNYQDYSKKCLLTGRSAQGYDAYCLAFSDTPLNNYEINQFLECIGSDSNYNGAIYQIVETSIDNITIRDISYKENPLRRLSKTSKDFKIIPRELAIQKGLGRLNKSIGWSKEEIKKQERYIKNEQIKLQTKLEALIKKEERLDKFKKEYSME